jgi:hypothetical protein
VLVLLAAAGAWATAIHDAPAGGAAPRGDAAGTFAFAAGVAPADRRAVLDAVAAARPEARRLIDLVDGRVEVRIEPTGPTAIGLAESDGSGAWIVRLDLARVAPTLGTRGIRRVVLHELGHVVDGTLVGPELAARLDAGIPAGWGCERGTGGACADRSERFAESFAKWASDDIGVDLYVGYRVPPPGPSLAAWGAPLTALTGVD